MSSNLLHIETSILREGDTLVSLEGRFTMEDAAALGDTLDQVHTKHPRSILIDCQKLDQVSSSAIGVLIASRQHAISYGGKLVLLGPNKTILNVLKLTGVDAILPVYETLEDARSTLKPSGEERGAP